MAALRSVRRYRSAFILLLTIAGLVTGALLLRPPGGIIVTFFDIGQGDATHIRALNNFDIVIDGGPGQNFSQELRTTMTPGDRTVELLIATHPDADHLSGLVGVLEKYSVQRVFTISATRSTKLFQSWQAGLASEQANEQATVTQPHQGDVVEVPGGRLEFLWPRTDTQAKGEKTNDAGLVFRFEVGDDCILFTADISEAVEKQLVAEFPNELRCEILKVGHHGSATSSSQEFVSTVDPETAVIMVGRSNRYRHPTTAALAHLKATAARILRTDLHGRITVRWPEGGGARLVKSEFEPPPTP